MAQPDVRMGWLDRVIAIHFAGSWALRLRRGNPSFTSVTINTFVQFDVENIALNQGSASLPAINRPAPLGDPTIRRPPAPGFGAPTADVVNAIDFYKWWRPQNQVTGSGTYHSRWDFVVNLDQYPVGQWFLLSQDLSVPGHPELDTINYQVINPNGVVVTDLNDIVRPTILFTWTGSGVTAVP